MKRRLTVTSCIISIVYMLLLANAAMQPVRANVTNRVALVIANSEYSKTAKLSNPANDGELIAGKLKELGFSVVFKKDLDARAFSEVIQDFTSKLSSQSEALFYYAGHGLQFRGENYLVGIDAQLKSEATLQFETFRLNSVLSLFEAHAGTTLLFWDACRNNPLAEDLVRSVKLSASRAANEPVRSGAAPLPPRRGDTLVVFSAEPGSLALDGSEDNSPFAASLGQHLSTPNVEIELMLKRVTKDVIEKTENFQRPERLSQLTREFYFRSEGADALAHEEELNKLRLKVAQLEQGPVRVRRYKIINSDHPSLRTKNAAPAKERHASVRGSLAKPADDSDDDTPYPSKDLKIPDPLSASENSEADDVVIAVNSPAATIVRKLRVSPNGKLLAVGDESGRLRIIGLETFEVLHTIQAHSSRVSDLDFSPDSSILLSSGRDGAVSYWDLNSGNKVRELSAVGAVPYSASINSASPDRWVLMGDRSGRLVAWDIKSGRKITDVQLHNGPVSSVAYQPGGKGTFFSSGSDGSIKVRFPEGNRISLAAHKGPIFQAAYSRSGRFLYSAGSDLRVKVWDANNLNASAPLKNFEGHLKYVLAVDMSPDESMLASGGGDKIINLWDVRTSELAGQLKGHTSDIEAVAFSPDGKFLVSASEDKTVRIWSVDDREELVRLFFQKDGDQFAGVTIDGQKFGDRNSNLLSVFVSGREVSGSEVDAVVPYIGRTISIVDTGAYAADINCEDVWKSASEVGSEELSPASAEAFIANIGAVDANGNNKISRGEFLSGCRNGLVQSSPNGGAVESATIPK